MTPALFMVWVFVAGYVGGVTYASLYGSGKAVFFLAVGGFVALCSIVPEFLKEHVAIVERRAAERKAAEYEAECKRKAAAEKAEREARWERDCERSRRDAEAEAERKRLKQEAHKRRIEEALR